MEMSVHLSFKTKHEGNDGKGIKEVAIKVALNQ